MNYFFQHTSKRVVLRRLSQDSDGKMLSCEIHLPNMKPQVTSPGPGPGFRGVSPTEGVFTYNIISGSNSSTGSPAPSQPLSPTPATMIFSPPASPLTLTPTPSHYQVIMCYIFLLKFTLHICTVGYECVSGDQVS